MLQTIIQSIGPNLETKWELYIQTLRDSIFIKLKVSGKSHVKSTHISFLVIDIETLLKKPVFRSQVNEYNSLELTVLFVQLKQ